LLRFCFSIISIISHIVDALPGSESTNAEQEIFMQFHHHPSQSHHHDQQQQVHGVRHVSHESDDVEGAASAESGGAFPSHHQQHGFPMAGFSQHGAGGFVNNGGSGSSNNNATNSNHPANFPAHSNFPPNFSSQQQHNGFPQFVQFPPHGAFSHTQFHAFQQPPQNQSQQDHNIQLQIQQQQYRQQLYEQQQLQLQHLREEEEEHPDGEGFAHQQHQPQPPEHQRHHQQQPLRQQPAQGKSELVINQESHTQQQPPTISSEVLQEHGQ
jgi:hypothetical protein